MKDKLDTPLHALEQEGHLAKGVHRFIESAAQAGAAGGRFNFTDVLTQSLTGTVGDEAGEWMNSNQYAPVPIEGAYAEYVTRKEIEPVDAFDAFEALEASEPKESYIEPIPVSGSFWKDIQDTGLGKAKSLWNNYGDDLINVYAGMNQGLDILSSLSDSLRDQSHWYEEVGRDIKTAWNYASTHKMAIAKEVGSLALDFIPVVGQVKVGSEIWTGKSITGEEVNRFTSALMLIPGAKIVAKTFKWLSKSKSVAAMGKAVMANKYASSMYKATSHSMNYLKGNRAELFTQTSLGMLNGAYGSFSSGGSGFDIMAGSIIGGMIGPMSSRIHLLKNQYVASTASNLLGQGASM